MNTLLSAIGSAVIATLICENVLWRLFYQKVKPLSFPHELDTSYFRFFSVRRLEFVAIVHTIILSVCLGLFCFYLW